jgi:3-dehydroquinate synthase
MSVETVPVDLAGRSYVIRIGRGVLAQAADEISALGKVKRIAIITDQTVSALHLHALAVPLKKAGYNVSSLALPAGERTKSWACLEQVSEFLIENRLERNDLVIAFGGGVIGDLAGFASAIVRRGLRYVQIPTTLLAQVDSSVGGKTAINSPRGKNLIGAFHQPSLVLADTALLDTLPLRDMRAGYAEVVKYGFLGDRAFFEWLEAGAWQEIFSGGPAREEAVRRSCLAKAAIVARDETEQGDRALLNLGHTFGHALEAAVQYDAARLVHGEAVAIGMRQAFAFSHGLGLISGQEVTRARKHLEAVGLPVLPNAIPGGVGTARSLLEAIRQDKKVSAGALTFILVKGIGESFISRDIDPDVVRAFLEKDIRRDTSGA